MTGDPVGGADARRRALEELSRAGYRHAHHSTDPLHRVIDWIRRHVAHLFDSLGTGGGHAVLLIVVVLLVLAVAFGARAGLPGRRTRRTADAVEDPLAPLDARRHRELAQEHEAAGRLAEALREYLRAAVATVEERGVLPPQPGRTGATTALQTAPVLPTAADDLAAAVRAFDEVWFGGRTAVPGDVARARAAADEVARARPRRGDGDPAVPAGMVAPW